MLYVEQTIISQYGTSATITQLVRNMDQYIDPRTDFDAFYDYVWNVETAQGFGLDIWGRIVNISRELKIPDAGPYFGFSEANMEPFGQAPFMEASASTQTYLLADDAYRQLILVKALTNISSTNAPTLNQLLQNMFAGRGRCYVNDLGGMQLRYTFEFLLTPYEFAIMTQSGAIPRPAGVGAILITTEVPYFGFSEGGGDPFGEAPFMTEGSTHAIS
jgi:hypothetical protein